MIASLLLAAAIAIPSRPSDYVTDNAGALSVPAAQRIRDELRTYELTTQHHVIVWIGETTGDTPLEDWTIHAAEQWKVGRKGVDDGAILFLFMRDHKVRIEVGYGLESALTDADASRIIYGSIVPRMRAGDTDGAVQAGVDGMLLTITPSFASHIGHSLAPEPARQGNLNPIVVLAIIPIFIVLWLTVMILAFRFSRRGAWYWGTGAGGWSSGGGGWSSGGGSSGGGGGSFGGSFGGGGASGGW